MKDVKKYREKPRVHPDIYVFSQILRKEHLYVAYVKREEIVL
jgi:hypothetical protein